MTYEIATNYEKFVKRLAPQVANVLGVKNRKIKVLLADTVVFPILGLTSGRTIFLNARWFAEHPDDYSTIVHEIAHAVMNIQVALETEDWLIEGLADYTREVLGYQSITGSSPDYDPERLFEGYEPTAHFFLWLRSEYGEDVIKGMSKRISEGKPFDVEQLKQWLHEYKADNEGSKN